MHYKTKGMQIKTENAAKSALQASRYLTEWIESMDEVDDALDYGCGKLRYATILAQRTERLTLVDSSIQINRVQSLCGERTNMIDYVRTHLPNSRVLSIDEFNNDASRYDFVLCSNVLSAIPNIRTRSKVLRRLAESLKEDGGCLFVTQFRNSYFKQTSLDPKAIPHLDGWIIRSARGNFYYGILDENKLRNIVARHNFAVIRSWINGESAYVLAERQVR